MNLTDIVSESSSTAILTAKEGRLTDPVGTECTQDDVRRTVTESLDKLGFIPDLILLHNPFLAQEKSIAEFYGYVEELVKDGTLRGCSLGLSNFR